MQALIYEDAGKISLKERAVPKCGSRGAVVRIETCSICGTDLRTYTHGSVGTKPGRIIGHELCGEIVAVGSELDEYGVGQRVTIAPAIGCGKCSACRRGHTNLCSALKTIGFQIDGGFAEFMEIPASAFSMGNVSLVPNDVKSEKASLIEPVACVANGQEFLSIERGDTIAIFGAGFIGCIHAELAHMKGASKVLLVEPNLDRRKEAQRLLPFITPIEVPPDQVRMEVSRLTSGDGVDSAITACPVGAAQMDALYITAAHGHVSLFGGLPSPSTGFLDSNLIHYKELSVVGSHASTPAQNRQVLEWIASGQLDVSKYVGEIYPLSKVVEAFEDLKKQRILKAIIRPD